jgi:hypothetical protein
VQTGRGRQLRATWFASRRWPSASARCAESSAGKTLLSKALAAVLHDITGARFCWFSLSAAIRAEERADRDSPVGRLDRRPGPGHGNRSPRACFPLNVPARPARIKNYYGECGSTLVLRFSDRFPFHHFDIDARIAGGYPAIDCFPTCTSRSWIPEERPRKHDSIGRANQVLSA